MDTSKCYTLEDFTVREYGGTKYLSIAKEGSKFYPIADIGNIKTSQQSNDDQDQTILNAVIIGVLQLDSYKSCLRCKARVESISDTLGRCSKADCAMLQRFDVCNQHSSAKLLCMSDSNTYSLYVYGSHVKELACVTTDKELTEETFLKAPKLSKITFTIMLSKHLNARTLKHSKKSSVK